MVNPESFSRLSVFRFLSLVEVGHDFALKLSYLEAIASFYREDEQAKAEGRTHQGSFAEAIKPDRKMLRFVLWGDWE